MVNNSTARKWRQIAIWMKWINIYFIHIATCRAHCVENVDSQTLCWYVNAMLLFEGRQVSIIYLVGNVADISRMVVKSDSVDVSKYVRAEQLCKYFYDVREWYDPETVIARATSVLGSTSDKQPFKDPQHFAMWCKTGTCQLHCWRFKLQLCAGWFAVGICLLEKCHKREVWFGFSTQARSAVTQFTDKKDCSLCQLWPLFELLNHPTVLLCSAASKQLKWCVAPRFVLTPSRYDPFCWVPGEAIWRPVVSKEVSKCRFM